MTECFLHYDSVTDDVLSTLGSRDAWETILNAAKIRECVEVVNLNENLSSDGFPIIKFHRKCRAMFTMKRDLAKIEERKRNEQQPSSSISNRKSIRSLTQEKNATVLPLQCIFCKKDKYLKGSRTRESLLDCVMFSGDGSIRAAAELRNDEDIKAICTDELIAKSAHYHATCYRAYTVILSKRPKEEQTPVVSDTELAFEAVRGFLMDLHEIPDIVEYTQLKSVYEGSLKLFDNVTEEDIKHLKKNLRRKIENSIKGFTFIEVDRRVYVFPNSLQINDVVGQVIKYKGDLKAIEDLSEENKNLRRSAKVIRDEIVMLEDNIPWPPQPENLTAESFNLPPKLSFFLKNLLSGKFTAVDSKRVDRLKMSFGQDLIYAISNGKIKTPKSILYPYTIKSLTNNTELITITNRLGHGVSYNIIEELETENAFAKLEIAKDNDGIVLPDGCQKNVFSILVADNIDRLEETLSGYGTSHKVNSIIVQPGSFGAVVTTQPPKKKRCRRSLLIENQVLPVYHAGKRCGPQALAFPSNEERDFLFAVQDNLNLVWALARKHCVPQHIPSWTGFHIEARNNIAVLKTSVGYLDCIDAPATNISTVYHILQRSMKIKDALGLQSIVCVFNQAIYCKAMEIKWKKPEEFSDCVIMLGIFHTLMMYLGIFGKRFSDGALRDLLIQSEVVAEGSVDRVLNGKMYNRSVRCVKLVYEALSRMLLERFERKLEERSQRIVVDNMIEQLTHVINGRDEGEVEEFIGSKEFVTYSNCFIDFIDGLKEAYGNLANYWLSFIDMAKILLNVIYATRSGSWDLLLESLKEIIPYTFAYDNVNYSRYLTVMVGELSELESKNPYVYNEFKNGNFTAQLSENQFSRLEPDKVIEMTINKDTKTPGGTTGFSTNMNSIRRWTLNASYRASLRKCLYSYVNYQPPGYLHKDLTKSRIVKDEKDVEALISTFDDLFLDPFSQSDLVCISNGLLASEEVTNDIMNAHKKGKEAMELFIDDRLSEESTAEFFKPIKKLKLKSFSSMKKTVTTKVKDKTVTIVSHSNVFGQLALIMQSRTVDLKEVFKYPLGPFPWALCGNMGELRKTNKSALMHLLEKGVNPVDDVVGDTVTVIDGMAAVQKMRVSGKTFFQMSQELLAIVLSLGSSSKRIDVVFDKYIKESIKNAERLRRSQGRLIFQSIIGNQRIKQWSSFLSSSANKNALISFIVEDWKQHGIEKIPENQVLFVAYEAKCYRLIRDIHVEVLELASTQEEADTRMLLHILHGRQDLFSKFIVHTPDTDVLVLCLGFLQQLGCEIYIKTGVKDKSRYIALKKVEDKFEKQSEENGFNANDLFSALIALHAFTGCDTVSSFSGKGKSTAVKCLLESPTYVETFQMLGSSWEVSDDLLRRLEIFTCKLYRGKCDSINLLRYEVYCSKRGKVTSSDLPPCQSAFIQHCKRANYQSRIWRLSLEQDPDVPSPVGHGWKMEGDDSNEMNLAINWMDCNPAPDEVLGLLMCDCKRKCVAGSCTCIDSGLKCTSACRLKDCQNQNDDVDDDSDSEDDFESDDDSDEDV